MNEPDSAVDAVQLSGEEYRTLVEQSDEVIFIVDLQGCVTYMSPGIQRLAFYRPEEVLQKPSSLFVHPADLPGLQASFEDTLHGILEAHQFRVLVKGGGVRHVQMSSRPLRKEGEVKGLIGVLTDISSHKRTEEVQKSIYRISAAVQATDNLDELYGLIHGVISELMPARNFYIALYDESHDLIHFPYYRDEQDTETWGPIHPGRTLTGYVLRTKEPLLATPEVFQDLLQSGEVDLVGPPSVDWLGVPLKTQRGDIIGVMGVQTYAEAIRLYESDKEILVFVSTQVAMAIERKRAEERLRREHALLSTLIKHLPDAVYVKDRQGRFLYANPVVCRLMEAPEPHALIGKTDFEFYPQELAEEFRADETAILQSGKALLDKDETRGDEQGNKIRILTTKVPLRDENGEIVGLVGVSRDLTEQKNSARERARLEEQLRQSQKLESIGRLAGGIAHDFNNLLTAISGNLQLASMDLDQTSLPAIRLQEALKASQSAATLTQQLLAFSRKQIIEPRVIDLNEILSSIREMLTRLIGEDVELIIHSSNSKALVRADPGQIEQMVINLCVNSRDAMPDGGTLTLGISDIALDETYCENHKNACPGKYICLSVSDSGLGISKEVIGQIFEPFFTTKATGKGTGLGLAMVYGAVKQNEGSIEVYSEQGKGTSFKIYLPQVVGAGCTPAPRSESGSLPAGSETVLLVEDADFIRSFAHDILTRLGYQVFACANVKEALDRERQCLEPIDLLLTDVILPDGNARDLAAAIASRRPQIKTLYTSGYAEDVIAHHGVLDPGVQFIGKPFSAAGLARRIRQILDQS